MAVCELSLLVAGRGDFLVVVHRLLSLPDMGSRPCGLWSTQAQDLRCMGLVRGSSQPGTELVSAASPAPTARFFTASTTWESSRSMGQPHVSCIGKRTLNHWTTREEVLGCLGKASEQPVPLLSGGRIRHVSKGSMVSNQTADAEAHSGC